MCIKKNCGTGTLKHGAFEFERGGQNVKGAGAAPRYVALARTLIFVVDTVVFWGFPPLPCSLRAETARSGSRPVSCSEVSVHLEPPPTSPGGMSNASTDTPVSNIPCVLRISVVYPVLKVDTVCIIIVCT